MSQRVFCGSLLVSCKYDNMVADTVCGNTGKTFYIE